MFSAGVANFFPLRSEFLDGVDFIIGELTSCKIKLSLSNDLLLSFHSLGIGLFHLVIVGISSLKESFSFC